MTSCLGPKLMPFHSISSPDAPRTDRVGMTRGVRVCSIPHSRAGSESQAPFLGSRGSPLHGVASPPARRLFLLTSFQRSAKQALSLASYSIHQEDVRDRDESDCPSSTPSCLPHHTLSPLTPPRGALVVTAMGTHTAWPFQLPQERTRRLLCLVTRG